MDTASDALKVYAIVEKAALRLKGQRGPTAATGLTAAVKDQDERAIEARQRSFLLREELEEHQTAMLLEKRKEAAAQVRKALRDKAKELLITRPLRRFGMKLVIQLVHHRYEPARQEEIVTRRMVVMEDSIKFEALDSWVRTCLGFEKEAVKLQYQYVSLNGHPTVIDSKTALQNWLDVMWAVHPPTLHAFDNDGLLAKAQDQTKRIREIFSEYDGDGNGTISLDEMTNMVLEMDLHTLGVTKDAIANYVSDEFERVDCDRSGEIDFEEFKTYYESLQSFLKDKLSVESKHTHMLTRCTGQRHAATEAPVCVEEAPQAARRSPASPAGPSACLPERHGRLVPVCPDRRFREEYMEARSRQVTLGELVAGCGASAAAGAAATAPVGSTAEEVTPRGGGLAAVRSLHDGTEGQSDAQATTVAHPITNVLCGRLLLEAHGHAFGVEVLVPPSAVGEQLRERWIRAETVIASQVDYFVDGTGALGHPLSPTVCVELEQPSTGPRVRLDDDCTILLPLCIGSCMSDQSEIAKSDLAVCYGRWQTGEWLEVDSDNFELLPARPMARYGCEMPFCAVRVPRPGLVCVFSRMDTCKPRTRVRCVAYLPGRMSHIQLHRLRIYCCHAIPDELESLTVREQHERGSVSVGGVSEIFELAYGERVVLSVALKGGDGGAAVQTATINWKGELDFADLDFDPAELHEAAVKRRVAEGAAGGAAGGGGGAGGSAGSSAGSSSDVHGVLQVTVAIEDIKSRMRRGSVFSDSMRGAGGSKLAAAKAAAKARARFACEITVQEFPAPAPPTKLALVHRTNASLAIAFEPPMQWGGCALDRHEVELREITKEGSYHEKGWHAVQEIPAGRSAVTQIACRVWKAEVRVRTWNIASERPSEWSEIFEIGEPTASAAKEGGAKEGGAKVERAGKSKTDVVAAARKGEKAELKKGRSSVENGIAMVMHLGVDEQFMVRHTMSGAEVMEAQGWSPFRRAIGGFYVEAGVFGGCEGRLFDFGTDDVEALVSLGDDPKLDVARPLLSLATIACYVLQTLSQHAVVETEAWITLANEVAMLVDLARQSVEDDATRALIRSLLTGLIDVYESLVQCEEEGYIARQLNAKYEKGLKLLLRRDWEEQMLRLRNRLATDVMGLVLYERLKLHTSS